MTADWLTGFGGAPRRPANRGGQQPQQGTPPPKGDSGKSGPLTTWRKGQVRAVVEVACCPECGSTHVKIRTTRGPSVVVMECLECDHRWKDCRADRLS